MVTGSGGMGLVTAILLGLSCSLAAFAQSPQQQERAKRQFQERARTLGDSISADNSAETARCKELRQQMETYRDRPQRGYSARRNYEAECMREEFGSDGLNSAPFSN